MEFNEETNERIEQYLAGTLSEAERMAFEKELEGDAVLAEALAVQRQAQRFLGDQNRMNLRNLIAEVGNEYASKEHPATKSGYFLRIAAALIFLLGIGTVYWFIAENGKPANSQELFAEYYAPYPAYNTKRSDPESQEDAFSIAMELYEQQKYSQAQVQLEQLIQEEKAPQYAFYLGICLLEQEKSGKAESAFNEVISHGNTFYMAQSEWYLALTYLQTGDTQSAIQSLQSIAGNEDHSSHQKALELLKLLED